METNTPPTPDYDVTVKWGVAGYLASTHNSIQSHECSGPRQAVDELARKIERENNVHITIKYKATGWYQFYITPSAVEPRQPTRSQSQLP